jgi:hypothetical protein
VSSENCQKLARLGTLEDSFKSLVERLLRIYYDREKKTTTATGNRRAGTREPNNTDMNIVVDGKRSMVDSRTVGNYVIILYLARCHTYCCSEYSPKNVLEVYKK